MEEKTPRLPSLALGLILGEEDGRLLPDWLTRHAAPFDVLLLCWDGEGLPRSVANLAERLAPQPQGRRILMAHPLAGDFAAQRNFLAAQNPCEWLLMLDADERVEPAALIALRRALGLVLQDHPGLRVLGLPRYNTIDGVSTNSWPDTQYRLVRRDVRWRNMYPAPGASPGCHEKPREILEAPETVAIMEALVIDHPKSAKRQARQKAFYRTLAR